MNASDRTTLIAEGIALWAKVQNLPGSTAWASEEVAAWNKWAVAYPAYIDFVKREQFALFDRVNAAF